MDKSPFWSRFLVGADSRQNAAYRYGAAIAVSLAFIALRWLLGRVIDDGQPYAILFIPVALSAFYGGFGPGLVAVLTTIAFADYFLIPPLYTIGLPDTKVVVATLLFSIAGLVISALGEARRVAMSQASGEAEVAKLAQHQLLNIEERLNIVEQLISGGAWSWDLVNDTVYWSDGYRRLLDYPLDEPPLREKWVACLHPEDRDRTLEQVEEFFRQKRYIWSAEYRMVTASGRVRWISAHGQAFYDTWGKPVRMVGINLDISARRFAEDPLQEAEPQARTG